MRVGYLGPQGTFTEEALRASSPGAVDEIPYATVYEVVMAVQSGEVARGVVPIENSLEGSVNATLDALAGEAQDVRIVGEVLQQVRHCLIARDGLELDQVTRVLSHPQAVAQCGVFVRDTLGGARIESTTSTAEAVRLVSESDEPWAAIGSGLAAEIYGCDVVAAGIEDRGDNLTRFVWLARADADQAANATKTSIVFWGFNDESPGALVGVLDEFATRGVNLTRIESRPRRVRLGHYMFFADLEGGAHEPAVSAALEALRGRVSSLRVLGSYVAACSGYHEAPSATERGILELAEAAYAAINRRDLDAFLALVHPEVEFRSPIAEAEGRSYHGHAGVREWWQSVAQSLGGLRFEPGEIRTAGAGVITRLRVVGTVEGNEVPQTMWQVAGIRDGLLAWWGLFRTKAEAVEALGAGE